MSRVGGAFSLRCLEGGSLLPAGFKVQGLVVVVVVVVVVGPLLASTACSQGFEVGSLKLTWRVRELILKYIYSYIVYS